MQLNSEVIANFRNFIQMTGTVEDLQQMLKTVRNVQIMPFSLKDSRCIWMSLLLYKFKKDLDVSEELWLDCRQVIL